MINVFFGFLSSVSFFYAAACCGHFLFITSFCPWSVSSIIKKERGGDEILLKKLRYLTESEVITVYGKTEGYNMTLRRVNYLLLIVRLNEILKYKFLGDCMPAQ